MADEKEAKLFYDHWFTANVALAIGICYFLFMASSGWLSAWFGESPEDCFWRRLMVIVAANSVISFFAGPMIELLRRGKLPKKDEDGEILKESPEHMSGVKFLALVGWFLLVGEAVFFVYGMSTRRQSVAVAGKIETYKKADARKKDDSVFSAQETSAKEVEAKEIAAAERKLDADKKNAQKKHNEKISKLEDEKASAEKRVKQGSTSFSKTVSKKANEISKLKKSGPDCIAAEEEYNISISSANSKRAKGIESVGAGRSKEHSKIDQLADEQAESVEGNATRAFWFSITFYLALLSLLLWVKNRKFFYEREYAAVFNLPEWAVIAKSWAGFPFALVALILKKCVALIDGIVPKFTPLAQEMAANGLKRDIVYSDSIRKVKNGQAVTVAKMLAENGQMTPAQIAEQMQAMVGPFKDKKKDRDWYPSDIAESVAALLKFGYIDEQIRDGKVDATEGIWLSEKGRKEFGNFNPPSAHVAQIAAPTAEEDDFEPNISDLIDALNGEILVLSDAKKRIDDSDLIAAIAEEIKTVHNSILRLETTTA